MCCRCCRWQQLLAQALAAAACLPCGCVLLIATIHTLTCVHDVCVCLQPYLCCLRLSGCVQELLLDQACLACAAVAVSWGLVGFGRTQGRHAGRVQLAVHRPTCDVPSTWQRQQAHTWTMAPPFSCPLAVSCCARRVCVGASSNAVRAERVSPLSRMCAGTSGAFDSTS